LDGLESGWKIVTNISERISTMKRTTTVLESNADSLGAAFTGLISGASSHSNPAVFGASSNNLVASSAVAMAGVKAQPVEIVAHDCKGKNDCKGNGGCKSGDKGCKGKNSCKGNGGCKSKGTRR
jgi:hypothetical protein